MNTSKLINASGVVTNLGLLNSCVVRFDDKIFSRGNYYDSTLQNDGAGNIIFKLSCENLHKQKSICNVASECYVPSNFNIIYKSDQENFEIGDRAPILSHTYLQI